MKSALRTCALGLLVAGLLPVSALRAAEETSAKPLPVLLIKGEVVSMDTNDPTVSLLKVKDRYGFETPIYVTPEAKISQGGDSMAISNLTTGSMVDVEYNFDVNTAKRHAVSVKLAAAPTAAAALTTPSSTPPAAAVPAPTEVAPATESATPAAPAEPAAAPSETAPAEPEAAPAAQ